MRTFFLLSCLALTLAVASCEPPLTYLSPQRAQSQVYQQLPREQSWSDFSSPSSMYGLPLQEDTYNAAYLHSSAQHETGYANAPLETQVHKHIYVHVPPQDFEDDDVMPRVTHQMAPKQKHYKIVFIKTPSAPALRPPVVPPTPQNEEKTLIYVLHKRPESQPNIVIPTPAPTSPSKPEVYFIKYKSKKDESPVYGPPPPTYDMQARSAIEPSVEYASPLSNKINDFSPLDLNQYESQITTDAPGNSDEVHAPQFVSEGQQSDSFTGDEVQTTDAVPLNHYLPPDTTLAPIVVAETEPDTHAPAIRYGAPIRHFIKKKK